MCEMQVGCVREVAERIHLTVSQWACLGLAATLPLPMVGSCFEDERGGGAVDGEYTPKYGVPVPGHAAGHVTAIWASSVWVLTLPI